MLDLLVKGIANIVVNEIIDSGDCEHLGFIDNSIESFKLIAKEIDSYLED